MDLNARINTLSADEIDLLMSDDKLMSDFKAKYSSETPKVGMGDLVPKMAGLAVEGVGSNIIKDVGQNLAGLGSAIKTGLYDIPKAIGALPGELAKGLVNRQTPETSLGQLTQQGTQGMAEGIKSFASDPLKTVAENPVSTALTFAGMPEAKGMEGVTAGWKLGAEAATESKLPRVMKTLAEIPEMATEIAQKEGFKLPKVTKPEIIDAAKNVSDAFNNIKSKYGETLNSAKKDVGLPISVAEKEDSIGKYNNSFNISSADLMKTETGEPFAAASYKWKEQGNQQYYKLYGDKEKIMELTGNKHGVSSDVPESVVQKLNIPVKESPYLGTFKQPNDLINAISDFKNASGDMSKSVKARTASYLQDQINQFIDFNKSGDQTQGILKQQYGDLGKVIEDSSPALQQAKAKMGNVYQAIDGLEKKLSTPGKAHDYIRRLFVSGKEGAKEELAHLAELEALTGKPIVTELLKKFSSEAYQKWVSRPGREVMEAVAGGASAALGHPGGALAAGIALGVQSPKMLGMAAKMGARMALPTAQTIGKGLGLNALKGGFPLSDDSRSKLQSIRDKLRNNAK